MSGHKSDRTLDCFLVSPASCGSLASQKCSLGVPCPPRRPVRSETNVRPREQPVHVFRKLARMPSSLPFGPRAQLSCWAGGSRARHSCLEGNHSYRTPPSLGIDVYTGSLGSTNFQVRWAPLANTRRRMGTVLRFRRACPQEMPSASFGDLQSPSFRHGPLISAWCCMATTTLREMRSLRRCACTRRNGCVQPTLRSRLRLPHRLVSYLTSFGKQQRPQTVMGTGCSKFMVPFPKGRVRDGRLIGPCSALLRHAMSAAASSQ